MTLTAENSAALLGSGTTVTHGAMSACADSNTPVCWIGEEGMRFYAFFITPNHDNLISRKHAAAWADKKKRTEIARRMIVQRPCTAQGWRSPYARGYAP